MNYCLLLYFINQQILQTSHFPNTPSAKYTTEYKEKHVQCQDQFQYHPNTLHNNH